MAPTSSNQGPVDTRRSRQAVTSVPESRVVSRPVPVEQAQDPRGFELNQLRRRYKPQETPLPYGGIMFSFKFPPSDPDFPFDLDSLHCELRVPGTYPDRDIEGPPTLAVKNPSMPRGFAINIEHGWEKIVEEREGITLANMVRVLDTQLESLLSATKAETVKLVHFKDTRHLEPGNGHQSTSDRNEAIIEEKGGAEQNIALQQPKEKLPPLPREVYTKEQISEAKSRRGSETQNLEYRMRGLKGYHKESDGVVYTLPFEPREEFDGPPLPEGLKTVTKIHLILPLLYPLQTLRIQLVNATDESLAERVEDLFSEKSIELLKRPRMNLLGLLNWLASNLADLAEEIGEEEAPLVEDEETTQAERTDGEGNKEYVADEVKDDIYGRRHIKIIPRPPEWTFGYRSAEPSSLGESSEVEREESSSSDEEDFVEAEGDGAEDMDAEKGTALSFSDIDMQDIELLTATTLGIRVKCNRCKTINDITGLNHAQEKSAGCSKCTLQLAARYRKQPIHINSNRIGFLDMVGCTVVDMLPSIFIPTCAACSTDSAPFTLAKGDKIMSVCRTCHTRLKLSVSDAVKLQVLTAPLPSSSFSTSRQGPPKPHTPWKPGQQLPDRGTCPHYRRSFRWFRFNCCKRVHACDHCHDEAEDHVHDWAERMVCGFCGREGRYAPNMCGFCGRGVVGGHRGRGFWEGGRGTREKAKMNRKEKRKYKRAGGGAVEREREMRKMGA